MTGAIHEPLARALLRREVLLYEFPPRPVHRRSPAERVAPRPSEIDIAAFSLGRMSIRLDPSLLFLVAVLVLVLGVARGLTIALAVILSIFTTELVRGWWVARITGSSRVSVTPFGGLLALPTDLPRACRARIALLGPLLHGVQALAWLSVSRAGSPSSLFVSVHASLALLQLCPTQPFDGAVLVETWLDPASHRRLVASIVGCFATCAAGGAVLGARWAVVPFALALVSCVASFVRARSLREDERGPAGVLLAYARMSRVRRDFREALRAAREAFEWARSTSFREAALDEVALAHIGQGDLVHAQQVLTAIVETRREPFTLAALALASGRPAAAVRLLEGERARGEQRAESTRLLVDALIATGEDGAALAVAIADQALLTDDELGDAAHHGHDTGLSTAAALLDAVVATRVARRARGTGPA